MHFDSIIHLWILNICFVWFLQMGIYRIWWLMKLKLDMTMTLESSIRIQKGTCIINKEKRQKLLFSIMLSELIEAQFIFPTSELHTIPLIVIQVCTAFVLFMYSIFFFAPLDVFFNTVMLRWIQADFKEKRLRFWSFKYTYRKSSLKPVLRWHCEYWIMAQVYITNINFQNCTETLMRDIWKQENPHMNTKLVLLKNKHIRKKLHVRISHVHIINF